MSPTEMLTSTPAELSVCEESSWNELIQFLITDLQVWLGYEIDTEDLSEAFPGPGPEIKGFTLDVLRAPRSAKGPCYWNGILGASVGEDGLLVSLSVFVQSDIGSLVTRDGKEYQEYMYQLSEDGWTWKPLGWFQDTYGEFDSFTRTE